MTLTLFPIRLLLAAFMMLLAWPFALVASLGPAERAPEQPLALWRKVVDFLLKAIMRTMWFVGGFHWVTVKGRQALPTEAAILTLAPHSSYFDAIPVTMTMSSIVMKAESRDIPIWGTLIKYIRPVFVSRSDQDSRRRTVEEIKRRAQSNGKWPQIMIFPEGTCTNRTCLITFKPGAFIPGVPVQPVVLRYPNKLDTITWTWQGPGALEILWLTLCQFHNQIEIEFLPVYNPSEEEKKDPALYASNVRRVMAEALGVSVTDYTFEDCQLALAEGQLRLPADTCLLEFARLVRGLGLKPEKLEKDLNRYAESAGMKRGAKINVSEFAAYLEVPVSDPLADMFSLFDESGSGEMDPREYVVALSVVCRPAQTLDTIQLAFKPTSAGLQKRTPTLQRSICTPTSRLSRAVHRRLPLSPPTASVLTSAPRTRMLGGSLCGRNWTRTEGAGETRLLPGSRHPPPHGREPSAVTISGLHSPRRLLGHCPQAQVPEAGVFPLCSSVGHRPEGHLEGNLMLTPPGLLTARPRGACPAYLGGAQGSPCGQVLGSGWTPGVACFQVSWVQVVISLFPRGPCWSVRGTCTGGQPPCTLEKRGMWHVFDSRQTLC
ncbi:PREDICTED: lysophosphatidylcholine acyltransferase 1 isoform X1 [Myotis brandtii]|uniref:lysophosphatidylcholine acyltransferase 1 isoform X1 n=1 Tax=Myotis brandtii TaxID=109478 RepID=UPI0007043F13|nr:PREDICTED: lysophosphatidylcholine acyltransferase 1 isoform X1 [Myotis brandtii]